MPATENCSPCCADPVVSNVQGSPGVAGEQGPQGEQGEPGETPELLTFTDYNAPAYTVTATPTQITGVSRILGLAGRYLIMARARFDANAATFAASRTITSYLYNASTSALIANSTKAVKTPITTTETLTLPEYGATVIYTAATDNEVIQMFTSVSVIPSAGTLTVEEAEIVVVQLD
jgi:hypothetical protein